jgi:dihydrofolate synthase/folylpolyglutamate synthase
LQTWAHKVKKGNKLVTYKEARVYLDRVSKYGSVLGLAAIRELLHELGDPQEELKFLHIAGTNGKGSILAYTSTILKEAGYRTGRYISPTVVSYRERIQTDEEWISEEAFARITEIVQKAIAHMEAAGKASPTVFEIETAIAFLYFKEQKCDIVVLECGLGGAEDATNIITTTVCAAFATISLDHLGVLGSSLAEIARTKSGIIKEGATVVSSHQQPEVEAILREEAKRKCCPIFFADGKQRKVYEESYDGQILSYREITHFRCPLPGRFQQENVITAIEIIRAMGACGFPVSEEAIRRGIEKTKWPGRFTCLCKEPLFFIDGAHNEDAVRKLRESLITYFPGKRFIYIMGVFRDKEYEKIASIMAPLARSVHTVDLPDAARTLPKEELAEVMRRFCAEDAVVCTEPGVQEAVEHVWNEVQPGDVILAFGSLSYLGSVMEAVEVKERKDI